MAVKSMDRGPSLQLEIPPEVLHRLLCHGTLHVDELRCLNHQSRHRLRRLLLENLKQPPLDRTGGRRRPGTSDGQG